MRAYDWAKDTLHPLLSKTGLVKTKPKQILVTGIDDSGKKTLLHVLTMQADPYYQMTIKYETALNKLNLSQYSFILWDISGQS